MSEARRARERTALALAALAVGAFLIRCRYLAQVFLDGRILPYDPDSSYHLWRIESVVRHGWPARFDAFLNAPAGAHVILPDGFDLALGWAARLVGGARASRYTIEVVSMLAMPLLGALAVLAIYPLARRACGRLPALFAVALAALLPAHVLGAILGHVDHHVLELGLPPLALAALLGAVEDRGRLGLALAAGLALFALAWSVPTAMLHVAVIAFGVAAGALGAFREDGGAARARRLLEAAALAFAIACVLMLPDAWTRHGFAFFQPSWLAPVLFAASAAVALALSRAAGRGARALAIALAVAGGLAMTAGALVLRGAAGFVGRHGVLSLVTESQPVTADPLGAFEMFSLLLPLAPLGWWWLSRRRPGAASFAIAAYGVAGAVLFCFQSRFDVVLAPPAVIGFAAAIEWLWTGGRARRGLVVAAAIAALAPSVRYLVRSTLATPEQFAMLESAEWLAAHTPTSGDRLAGVRADYSIASMWGVGSHYAFLADRPMLAGGLYHGDYAAGLDDDLQILFGDDPAPRIEARRVRYLVLPALPQAIQAANRGLLGLGAPHAPTLYAQLFDHEGSAVVAADGAIVPAREHLRLVHESPVERALDGREVPAVRVFERVAGAVVSGRCARPTVMLQVRSKSDVGRPFQWIDAAACVAGVFRARVPYSGLIELKRDPGPSVERASISESAVQSGGSVPLP